MNIRLTRSLYFSIFLFVVFVPLQEDIRGAETEKLNVVYSAVAAASIITWGPKEAGIYERYGLDVNLIYVAGAQAMTTLTSGDAQVVQGSGGAAVLSRLAGSDVTIIAASTNVIPMRFVAARDITEPKDLKGKTLGVTRFGSLTDLGLRKAVSRLGLDPEKDIKVIQTGGEPENLLFMQQGRIKGALLSSLNLHLARELGYRELVNLADIKFAYPATVLATTDGFIKTRPQILSSFLKATLEGIKYAKNNADFTMRVLRKYSRISDTKALASSYNDYVVPYIREFPEISSTEIESALTDLSVRNAKARTADPKDFFDPGPLEKLVGEGFIKRPSSR